MVTIKGEPIAVVDTNVILDLYSWHDFHDHFNHVVTWASVDNVVISDPQSMMRIARAREALMLAIHLHNTRAITFSISEALNKIHFVARYDAKKKLPRPAEERAYLEAFIRTFLWFVKERLLVAWREGMRVTPAEGNDADDLLLDYAKQKSIPLITNEGSTATGVNRKNRMRKLAEKNGVQIVKAADFYRDEMDADAEARAFFRRFRAEAPRYLKAYLRKNGKGKGGIHRILDELDSYYYLLLSNAPDDPKRKPVKLVSL